MAVRTAKTGVEALRYGLHLRAAHAAQCAATLIAHSAAQCTTIEGRLPLLVLSTLPLGRLELAVQAWRGDVLLGVSARVPVEVPPRRGETGLTICSVK